MISGGKKALLLTYLMVIHLLLLLLVWQSSSVRHAIYRWIIPSVYPETSWYDDRVVFQQRVDKNLPQGATVFLGDSLVEGLAVSAVIPRAVNFGIGQDTTEGLLLRLPTYQNLSRADLIVIEIGVNDLPVRTNDEIISNYGQILNRLSGGTSVLVTSILSVDEKLAGKEGVNHRIKVINQALKDMCKDRPNRYFLDMGWLADNQRGNYLADGIHLNKYGNKLWISALRQAIEKLEKNGNKNHSSQVNSH